MAKKVKIEIGEIKYVPNPAAPPQLLNSDGMMRYVDGRRKSVESIANSRAAKRGAIYKGDTQRGRRRCHGLVWTGNKTAIYDNYLHNTLLKALRGGR